MVTQVQLPPRERDFQVYQRVVLEGVSTRQAAGELSLSQTRVRQLVERVTRWLTEVLPARSQAAEETHLHLARHVAADRLQYLLTEAMSGWRELREMKYAGLALRVIEAQAKLPVVPGLLECLAADAIEGPRAEDVGQTFLSAREETDTSATASATAAHTGLQFQTADKDVCPTCPPVRDCSADSRNEPEAGPLPRVESVIKSTPAAASSQPPRQTSEARRAFFATAQLPTASDDLPVTELKITPEQLGFSSQKALSRRERRRLRKPKARA